MVDVLDVWLDGRFAGKLMRGEQDQVESRSGRMARRPMDHGSLPDASHTLTWIG